jgi:hypothetical protein
MALEFDLEKGDDLETIRQRLAEAAAWAEFASGRPGSSFPRSAELHPSHLKTDRKRLVATIARDRKMALRSNKILIGGAGRIEGRLLGYGPDDTVWDGASEAATMGFFDVVDEPPWDLWLGYFVEASGRSYLVSRVPPTFVDTAQNGIDVNPVACLFWLDELEQTLGLR